MRKLTTVIILLLTLCFNGRAQDSIRLNKMVELGSYYLYKTGEFKSDLDSADLFLDQAKELCAKLGLSEIQSEVRFLQAEVLFERADPAKARMAYLDAIDGFMRSGEKAKAANVWFTIAVRIMYSGDSTGIQGLNGFGHALEIYKELNDIEKEAEVTKYIGDRFLQQGRLDEAENEILQALSLYRSIGYKQLHYTYDLLVSLNNIRGDFNKALYYSLEMIKSMQASGDTADAYVLYRKVAIVYNNLNEYEKSRYWYNRALISGANDPKFVYDVNNSLTAIMIKEGKNKEALEFLLGQIKQRPPVRLFDKLLVVGKLADCYSLVGNDELAEKYYHQAIMLAKETASEYQELVADKQIGDFYFSRKKYGPAGVYLRKVLAIPRGFGYAEMIRSTYLELFKTDSATGHYLAAIKSYEQYKALTDSIFTVAKAKQITQLQLQFEKDQKVQQLEEKGKLQQAELQHAGLVRNFTIAGAGLLLLFLVMVYRRYRQKRSVNRLLQAQQHEKDILLKEKDTLLMEKDWLLKEVHHRVKNNLHTVICLLESQEIYLENDALEAIEICQRRIYAMSLIHQKLYQSDNIELVDMCLYIREFVQYLADSFGPPANIRIRSAVEPANLGISQAIPLGLILNEAVTNAFKYAFPDNRSGEIFIGLRKAGKNMELVIADDGIGIQQPVGESEPLNSLGIELMRGLTRDLKGNINFDTGAGTKIAVLFAVDSLDAVGERGTYSKRSSTVYDN